MSIETDTPSAYMIDESGKLFRKGEHIGDLQPDETIRLLPDHKNYAASVTRWLREKADTQESAPAPEAPKPKLSEAQKAELDNKGMTKEAVEAASKARALYKDDVDFATRTGCPQPPAKNPQFGDKTPAFVDWVKAYRPDEFAARYGVKGKAQVPIIKTNPETGIDEVTGYREADMAIRRTHLTEKIETYNGLGEDMDWNA